MKNVVEFLKSEDGASVVDMTVLMAFLCGAALAVGYQVSGGLEAASGDLEDTMTSPIISTTF